MDEIPLMIDPSKNLTYDWQGSKEILLIKCLGYREFFNCCFLISSNKIPGPTLLIFKSGSKKLANIITKKNENIYVCYNKKGWMNKILLENWYKQIFQKVLDKYTNFHNLLLFESAPCHLNTKLNYDNISIIPKGLTSLLQPIDVVIGKPYKDLVWKEFYQYFLNNHENITLSANIVKPKPDQIIKMHEDASKNLDSEILKKAFMVTGYTIALDGSENDQLITKLKNNENFKEEISKLLRVSRDEECYEWIDDFSSYREQNEINLEIIDPSDDLDIENHNESSSSGIENSECSYGESSEEEVDKLVQKLN